MGKLFAFDGPIIKIMNQIISLLWLNILTAICCIPVITIGAAHTAMHYVVLKISKGEDPKVTVTFFKAFKDNFKKATQVWIVYLFLLVSMAVGCFTIYMNAWTIPSPFWIFYAIIALLLILLITWTFILQSRYENDNVLTIKNAVIIGLMNPFCSVVILASLTMPFLLFVFTPKILPITLGFWMTVPAYIQSMLYNKIFARIEAMNQRKNEEVNGHEESNRD